MRFKRGDKVVHPAHGAGKVTAIKDKRFVRHSNCYYVIQIPEKRLTVMVPTDTADDIGLRPVSEKSEIDRMWAALRAAPRILSNEYKERQARIREKLSTGNIVQVAQAIRDLRWRQRERKLTQTDRELLEDAESFVAAELALARDLELEEALVQIRSAIPLAV